jgi:hypothetical protein
MGIMKSAVIAVLGSAVLATVAVSGASAQIVNNGGFETGSFAGWTQFGNTLLNDVAVGDGAQHSGTYLAAFGSTGSTGGITQALSTTAGDSYTFSFWLAEQGGGSGPMTVEADWNGASVFTLSNPGAFNYVLESFTETAASNSTPISFTFRDDPSFFLLDDVTVTDNSVAGSVTPEPATMTLMATGLVAMAGIGRRRRKNTK